MMKRRRITFSAITDAIQGIGAEENLTPNVGASDASENLADKGDDGANGPRQRSRRLALTPLTAVAPSEVAGNADSPLNTPAAASSLPPPPQREVRRRRQALGGSGALGAAPVIETKRLSGTKRKERDRESIGATARVEAMIETAANTLMKQDAQDASSEEEDSFAQRVRQANGFQCGARAFEALQAGGSDPCEYMPEPLQLNTEGVPTMLLDSLGDGISRSAFKRGARAAAAVGKVEAEMSASRPGSFIMSPGASSFAGSSVMSPMPAASTASNSTIQDAHTRPRLKDARVLAHSLFTP